jgi:hypothetical protein
VRIFILVMLLLPSLTIAEIYPSLPGVSHRIKEKPASYEYAPSIYFNNGASWVAFYCGTTGSGDGIYRLTTSSGGASWSNDKLVLEANGTGGEGTHACDPSIVHNGAVFHLFYTSETGPNGTKNKIHRAESTDGIKWVKRGVVVDMQNSQTTGYGAGQSSVLYDVKRSTWTMYYTDTSLGGNSIYRIDSAGLGTWPTATRKLVTLHDMPQTVSIDVAYNPTHKGYFGAVTSVGDAIRPGWIQIIWSDDGLNFRKIGEIPSEAQVNHNPGLLRSKNGNTGTSTRVFWGGGRGGPNNSGAPTWDLYMSDRVSWSEQ